MALRRRSAKSAADLADLEWRLSETGGLRPLLQAQARRQLADEGLPVTRRTVAQRACQILDRRDDPTPEPTTPNATAPEPTTPNATAPEPTTPDTTISGTTGAETSSTSHHPTLEGIAR